MNQQLTIDKMRMMRLNGMAQTHHQNLKDNLFGDYTIDQYINFLVEQEWEYRQSRKIKNLLRAAKFRADAAVENVDYVSSRGLDKNNFERLVTLDFIAKKENIIITGSTGTGKSYLAQALGRKACTHLYKTRYFTTGHLMDEVKLARIQGTYYKLIKAIQKTELLILDDFGLHPFDQVARQTLMDIVEYKYGNGSIIITSQIPVSEWHALIGEGTIADAILDRLVHSSHRIELSGTSMRRKKSINQ